MAECKRCSFLETRCHSILGHNIHGNFKKNVLKKCSMFRVGGVYSEEVHLYGKVECTSTNHSKYGGVHSKDMFDLIG